ncbi:MAG TPA: adenylate/guanylate cyclase domain-containing protein [Burkholderiales bacterium]|jgi:class 3 adenylate cyclase|nr:adenylate/guanylate cyclase domain-containing protein [Burkholderiales bacterium]
MSEPYSCAVLFADITGSTQLYEQLGDAQALARIDGCVRLLRDAAVEFEGRVVKTTGDGVMCSFNQAEAALHAARFMQVRLAAQAALGGPALAIHVGCHYGSVLESDGDLYGDCVNVAVRVVGLAKAGQVIATQEVVGRVGETLRARVRMLDHVALKGKREPLQIFEFSWQDSEELTTLGTRLQEASSRLKLVFGSREMWFDAAGGNDLRLGRDAACDIVIVDRRVSRQHARIEKRREKFMLIDQSANGTYVAVNGEPEICLRREELVLRSSGRICIGHRTGDADAIVVEFYCL